MIFGKYALGIGLLAALSVQGCVGGVSAREIAGYDNNLAQGNYAGEPGRTIVVLDEAEAMMKRCDLGTTAEKAQYHARTYDGVMVNADKAISAMHDGCRSDVARTELLRSEDRQSRAETDYQARVAADIDRGGGTLVPGQRFRAMVIGEMLTDPHTHEELGQLEQEVGVVEIVRVDSKISYAQLVTGHLPGLGDTPAQIVLRPASCTRPRQACRTGPLDPVDHEADV